MDPTFSIATMPYYFLIFIFMSFAGWVIEEVVVAVQVKHFANRGFLIGPICPIYGCGALLCISLSPLSFSPALVFFAALFGSGFLEYFTSFIMEKLWSARWWDYSKRKWNLHGRVYLPYLAAFGLIGLTVVYCLWPAMVTPIFSLPSFLVHTAAVILAILLAADFATSTYIIKNFKKITKTEPMDDTEDITAYVRRELAERGRLYRRLNAFNFIIPPRTLYYRDFTDDFVETREQDYRLPSDFAWIRKRSLPFLYLVGAIWARLHCFIHRIKFENLGLLRNHRGAYYIYANHTQALSDILNPVVYCRPRRVRLLAAPANLAIPLIGKALPDLGALPVPTNFHDFPKLEAAIKYYVGKGDPIIIYPEAHVWPWYTEIRPLPVSAFSYPVRTGTPSFTATTIYKKRRFGRKPRMVIHFDGPFLPDSNLSRRAATQKLHDEIEASLKTYARKSNCKYINYKKSRKKP